MGLTDSWYGCLRVSRRIRVIVVLIAACLGLLIMSGQTGQAAHADTGIQVDSMYPTAGDLSGGEFVTFYGSGLGSVTSVSFGGVVVDAEKPSATDFYAITPVGTAPGPVDVVLIDSTGARVTSPIQFTYRPPRSTITSISPNSGTVAGGTPLTIYGQHLQDVLRVTVGPANATITSRSPTILTVVTPAGSAGRVAVSTYGPNGQSDFLTYRYTTPPQIAYAMPSSVPLSGAVNVTLAGSYFDGVSSVLVDGKSVNFVVGTTYLSPRDKVISMRVPARATPGPATITLTSPLGTSRYSNILTYTAPPTITSVSPASVFGGGGDLVRIDGSGFVDPWEQPYSSEPLQVSVNGRVISRSALTVDPAGAWLTFPMVAVITSGDSQILVRNGFGQDLSTIRVYGTPIARALTPISGPSQGGETISLSGTDLDRVTAVHFGDARGEILRATPTSLEVRTPPSAIHGPGIGQVSVTVDSERSANIPTFQTYTYIDPPTLTSVTPATGEVVGGQTVTLTGVNLDTTRAVRFGSAQATVVDAQLDRVVVRAPAQVTPGVVNVQVTTADGVAELPRSYEYVDNRPVLTSLSPISGNRRGGNTVTLTGSHLEAVTSVRFGSTPATVVSSSASALSVIVPPSADLVDAYVVAENAAGESVVPLRYSYRLDIPGISGVSPASGPWAGGTKLVISGIHFEDATRVAIGAAAVPILSNTGTQIEVEAPPASTTGANAPRGSIPIVVGGPDGTATRADAYTYVLDVPRITSVTPGLAFLPGGETVTIRGENLETTRAVRFGYDGPFGTIIRLAPDSVDVVVPPATDSGVVSLLLANDFGSTVNSFTYVNPPPVIASVIPDRGAQQGGTQVRIGGSGFSRSPTVTIGGKGATLLRSAPTELVVVAPSSMTFGPVDIVISDRGGSTMRVQGFTYVRTPQTMILSPAQGAQAGGTSVTIRGSGLSDVTSVSFGGRPGTITSVSETAIAVLSPEATAPGFVDVVISNGADPLTLTRSYEYVVTPPSISAVNPASGDLAGGTRITITGSGFGTDPTVTIGGTEANVTSSNPAEIQVITPRAVAPGPVDVIVTTAAGQAISAGGFAYIDLRPVVTGIAPDSGPVTGGDEVSVTGENLGFVTSVKMGSGDLIPVTPVSDTQIDFTTPPATSTGLVDITLIGTHGNLLIPEAFTYERRGPVITSLSPNHGPLAGGDTVRIQGSRFGGLREVLFGTEEATVVSRTATAIVVRVPRGVSAGNVPVSVTSRFGRVSEADAYEYESPGPVLDAVGPNQGPLTGGNIAVLEGRRLGSATRVTFGGLEAPIQTQSATRITVLVPASQNPGPIDVVVTSPGGSDRLTNAYSYRGGQGGPGDDRITVSSVSPTSGPMSGGTIITITGSNLNLVTGATMGNPSARIISQSATSITLEAPPADSDYAVNIVLDHSKGGIEAASFQYVR